MKFLKIKLFFLFLILSFGWFFYAYVPKFIVEVKNPLITQARANFYPEYEVKPIASDSFKTIQFFSDDSLVMKANFYRTTKPVKATIILLHGIRSQKEQLDSLALFLQAKSYNVVAVDLRAHGDSGGAYCSFGYYEKKDLSNLLDYLMEYENIKEPIGIWGHSLGAAIGLQTLAFDKRFQFGIIESSYADFRQITKDYSSYFVGFESDLVNDFLLDRAGEMADFPVNKINPVDYCKNITQPVLIVHGTDDAKINVNNAKLLYREIASPNKELLLVKGAHHTDIHYVGGSAYFEKVLQFITKSLQNIPNNS